MSFKVCFHIMISFFVATMFVFWNLYVFKNPKNHHIDVKSLLIWRLQSFLLIKNLGYCGIKKWLE